MAELHVQPKRNSYWWIWLLLAIIIIGGAIYYYVNYYQKGKTINGASATDSTSNVNMPATGSTTMTLSQANLLDQVDFNSPGTNCPGVSHVMVYQPKQPASMLNKGNWWTSL